MGRKLLNQIKRNLKKVGEVVEVVEALVPEKGDRKNPDENWHRDSSAGLFFSADDVELIKSALHEYKPGFDDVNYRIIALLENINKRIEQLKKIPSGFEDA